MALRDLAALALAGCCSGLPEAAAPTAGSSLLVLRRRLAFNAALLALLDPAAAGAAAPLLLLALRLSPGTASFMPTRSACVSFCLNLPTGAILLTAVAAVAALGRSAGCRLPRRIARMTAPSGCASRCCCCCHSGPKASETRLSSVAGSSLRETFSRQLRSMAGVRLVVSLSSAASRMESSSSCKHSSSIHNQQPAITFTYLNVKRCGKTDFPSHA